MGVRTIDVVEEGALLAVNLGNDADTTGAVFGQLAGAFYGLDAMPARWLDRLYDRDSIDRLAVKLHSHATGSDRPAPI